MTTLNYSEEVIQAYELEREQRNFKLTEEQKETLKEFGYPDEDFDQIEEGVNCAIFKLGHQNEYANESRELLTLEEVQDLLFETDFLSGIGRAAFHWTSCRNCRDFTKEDDYTTDYVYIDMTNLFYPDRDLLRKN